MTFFRLLKSYFLPLAFLVTAGFHSNILYAQPTGFVDEVYLNNFDLAIGITFDDNGVMYAWEKKGVVYIVENGVKRSVPLLDIEEEVGNWGDFGLMSVALDPNYLSNGYIYLMYVVDRHHLLYHGTGAYNANVNVFFDATIGRITRYTVSNPGAPGSASINANTRLILLGNDESDGIPIVHKSHGPGSLFFGSDETLLVSVGDGASFSGLDVGYASNNTSYPSTGLDDDGDPILPASHDVGAYRAQILESYNGKILRLDKSTGQGLPSNPFWTGNADDVESKVWAYGFRNPFRASIRPNTGSFNPSEGNPGVIYLGDVGWNKWEELNVVKTGGQNFGWPAYQGPQQDDQYYAAIPSSSFFNITGINNTQTPPTASFKHSTERTVIYQNGNELEVGEGFPGDDVEGNSSTGGIFYEGLGFPEEYDDTYFHGDYATLVIQNYNFDANNEPQSVYDFVEGATSPGPVVCMASNPAVDGLFYVKYSPNEIRRIYYSPGNYPPTAKIVADKYSGPKPLEVNFLGDQSTDPDNDPLTYTWKVDGATFSTSANPTYTFNPSGNSPTEYTVTLEVSDGNSTRSTDVSISVNNTAPEILSTSIDNTNLYSVTDINGTQLTLSATVNDPDHSLGQLTFAWDVALHHNTHNHPEPTSNDQVHTVVLAPTDCDDAVYWYRVQLTVTDPVGASAYYRKDIYPNCPEANTGPVASFTRTPTSGSSPLTVDFDGSASNDPDVDGQISDWVWDFGDGQVGYEETVSHTYFNGGTYTVTLTTYDDKGASDTESKTVTVTGGNNNAPVAVAGATPTTGTLPLVVNFDGSGSSDSDGSIVSYAWNFGDGNTATGMTASNTYNAIGTYTAVLTVTDDDGASHTNNVEITVTEATVNSPPIASYTANPTTGDAPLVVVFDASGSSDPDGSIVSYDWEFGDGNSDNSGFNPSHTYTTAGNYVSQLIVTDNDGDKDTTTVSITVTVPNVRPLASFTATPDTVVEGGSVAFDASASSDSDGTISSYAWDFGDTNSGSTVNPSHSYSTAGTYTVQLIITDNDGGKDTTTNPVVVTTVDSRPVAVISATPTSGNSPLLVSFDGSGSFDIGGSITAYEWDFGDGSNANVVASAHPYNSQGNYTAQLIVTDNDGLKDTATVVISVDPPNVAPIADFTATPDTGHMPLTVSFDATASSDSDGNIVSWEWDFGNGNTAEGESLSNTYTAQGTYTAQLIVLDDDGARDTLTTQIVVEPPNVAPTATITASSNTGSADLFVAFDGSGSTDSDGTIASYTWDFGDGNTSNLPSPSNLFTVAGTYNVSLTVMDDDGALGYAQETITVTPGAGNDTTINPLESTYTNSNLPDKNYGNDDVIKLRNRDRIFEGFVKFNVGGINTLTSAKIQFYTANVDILDVLISGTSDGWDENTLTYNTRPAKTTGELAFATVDTLPGYYEADVTSYVQGELGGDGLISFYLEGRTVPQICSIVSDDGAFPPQLIISTGASGPNVGPTAQFTAIPTTGDLPLNVSFDATGSSDSDGTIALYAWDFGDGNTGTGSTISHTYTTEGTFTAELIVTDNNGASDTTTTTITTVDPNILPVAVISTNVTIGEVPLLVNFDGTGSSDSDGSITSYDWIFGDGNTASGSTQSNTYANAGIYTAQLIVTDNSGGKDTADQVITVTNVGGAPVAQITATPLSGRIPLLVSFDGNTSFDIGGSISTYAWDFGDGTTSAQAALDHTYTTAGSYTAELIVTDNDGNKDTSTVGITVLPPNTAPVASISATPTSGEVPLAVSFDGSGSSDSDGTISTYVWDMGDGTSLNGTLVNHTYSVAGVYFATLTVTDNEGATDSEQQLIIVESTGVGSDTTLNPLESTYTNSFKPDDNYGNDDIIKLRNRDRIFEGFIKFDIGGISSLSSAKIQFYTANVAILDALIFGTSDGWDENTLTYNTRPAKTTGELAFATVDTLPGYYEADVTSYVQGELGGDGLISFFLEGRNVPEIASIVSDDGAFPPQLIITTGPSGPNAQPLASLSATPQTGDAPLLVSFDGSGSTDSDGTIDYYLWDMGDGTTGNTATLSHTYTTPGTYTASLIVIDNLGGSDTATTTITAIDPNALPVAVMSVDTTGGEFPLLVNFDGSASTDSDGTIATYDWIYGDGSTGNGATSSHTYTTAGNFVAQLIVTDDKGGKDTTATVIAVEAPNVAPIASYTATPTTGDFPLTVAFDASGSTDSDGTIVSYAWSYGDGNTGSGETSSHVYTAAGNYTSQLIATDNDGASDTTTVAITVTVPNVLPVASMSIPGTVEVGSTANFDGSGSSDSDGSIVTYAWNHGDGSNSSGANSSHVYSAAGIYTVELIVTDDRGDSDTTSQSITVTTIGGVPVAQITAAPLSGKAPLLVSLSGKGSFDIGGSIASYEWSLGDGGTSTADSLGHTYTGQGSYTAQLIVTDNEGKKDTSTVSITVLPPNDVPVASLVATPTTGKAPLLVSLDGSGSSDTDGTITIYAWDHGDGSTSSGATSSHTYTLAGTYTLSLVVTDDFGDKDTTTTTIVVDPPNVAPVASIAASPTSGEGPLVVSLDGSGSSDSDGSIVSYAWDMGDGTTASGATASHSYSNAGVYFATLTVTDNDGATGTKQQAIIVESAAGGPPVTLSAVEDAWVKLSDANTNFGGDATIRLKQNGNFSFVSFIKFDAGSSQAVNSAKLRLYPGSATNLITMTVFETGTGWTELGITAATAPGAGGSLGSATFGNNTDPVEIDVTSHVATALAGGTTVAFRIESTNGNKDLGHIMAREGGQAAELVLNEGGGPANVAPVASLSATPQTGDAPLLVSFDGSGSSDSDGTIDYYLWDMGDGTTGNTATLSHTYTTPGTYTASLIVIDNLGGSDTTTTTITAIDPNALPVAVMSVDTTGGEFPLLVNFDGSASTDSDGTIATYDWIYGDGSTGNGATSSHTYTTAGNFVAQLIVTDDKGGKDTTATVIAVEAPNVAPIASYTATPTTGDFPLTVAFDASGSTDSDGTIVSYAWSYGDGNTGSGETSSHVYTAAGNYTSQLIATDNDGASDTTTVAITVTVPNVLPVASMSIPGTVEVGSTANFDGSGSSDSDGSIVTYAWNHGDGSNSSGANSSHVYSAAGIYTVELIVTDDRGDSDTTSQSITVTTIGGVPVAQITAAPLSGKAPLLVSLSGKGSFDIGGSIASYEWSLGDGGTSTADSLGHTYTGQGSYTAQLIVTDNEGKKDTSTVSITVLPPNDVPVASLVATPTTGKAPLLVSLDGSGSSDTDGTITIYAWDHGDGSTSSGATSSHTYTLAGTYTLSLVVTDDFGDKDTTTTTIVVDPPNVAPVASIAASPTSGEGPLVVSLDGSGSSDSDGSIVSYAWDMGDGTTASGATASHSYSNAGVYFATLTVTDNDGATGTKQQAIIVESAAGGPPVTLSAVEDAWVKLSDANTNFGGDATIRLKQNGNFSFVSFIKFDAGSSQAVNSAKLRLYPGSATNLITMTVFETGTGWTELGITAATAPGAGGSLGSATFGNNTDPVEIDVTSHVATALAGGTTVAFRIESTNGNKDLGHIMAREGGQAAELVLNEGGGPANVAPVASLSATPQTGDAPLLVSFDGSGSSDSDGTIDYYLWDMGDGTTGNTATLSHTYTTPGTYTASLIVIDNLGGSDTTTTTITAIDPNALPVAVMSVDTTGGEFPLLVNFDGSASTDSDGTIATYDWIYGDGSTGNGATSSHTYTTAGNFVAQLIVTDDKGGKDTTATVIAVEAPNVAPIASYTATPTTGDFPLTVAFDASGSTDSDGTIVSYAWSYGDGNTGSGETSSHVYTAAGNYTSQLIATDNDGASDTTTVAITVTVPNVLPVASMSIPGTVEVGSTANFDGSGSSDSDGSIVTYTWNHGDGSNSSGANSSHVYSAAGIYTVELIVTDDRGDSDTTSQSITVTTIGGVPVAQITAAPLSGKAPLLVSLSGKGSFDIGGSIASYEWSLGDGGTSTADSLGHTYTGQGSYTAQLIVTDNEGKKDTSTVSITVLPPNDVPVASLVATPTTGKAPLLVSLDGSGSSDTDGTITIYAWDHGDGSTSSGATSSHTYTLAGTYTLSLVVTDDFGDKDTTTTTIVVDPPNVAPVASIAASPTSGEGPLVVSLDGSGSSDSDGSIVSYAWDMGDGTTASGATASHSYSNAGVYFATLTVTDNDGATGTKQQAIIVESAAGGPPVTLSAVEDAWVKLSDANTNFGGDATIRLKQNGNFSFVSFIKFDAGSSQAVNSAKLRLYPGSATNLITMTVFETGTGWTELGITAATAPGAGGSLGSATFGNNTDPVEIDVTSHVATALAGGTTVAFRIESTNGNKDLGHIMAREGGQAAELVLNEGGGPANVAPVASLSATPQTGDAPLLVSFDGSGSSDSDGTIDYYLWDMGDGTTGNTATLSHTYTTPGTYTASLIVIDNLGGSDTATTTITVGNPNLAPTAVISATPTTLVEGSAVSFDGTGSSDPDGTIASYVWDFGDGNSSNAASPSHTYSTLGVYTATLIVTDNGGATDLSTETITVTNINGQIPPVAVVGATPTNGDEPLDVDFSSAGSNDPDGSIVSYAWDFGDGGSSSDANPQYVYIFPGTYNAVLTVTDNDGLTDSESITIVVNNVNIAPTALIATDVTSGDEPLTVAFTGSGSSDSDGSIVAYAWDFGDGGSSSSADPSYVFTSAGVYTVSLTVTDNEGGTDVATTTITVNSQGGPPVTLNAVEGTWTKSGSPNTNYGSRTDLRMRNRGNIFESMIKFDVSGVGVVNSATLRLYSENAEIVNILVYGTSDGWDENTVTYNAKPAKTTGLLNTMTLDPTPQYFEVDVTAYVQGEITGDDFISFFLDGEVTPNICYVTSDDGANPPQLVINGSSPTARVGREIEEEVTIHEVSVYPNPFTEYMLIDFGSILEETATVTLSTVDGKQVSEMKFVGKASYKIPFPAEQPEGVYILRVEHPLHQKVLRVVKM